MRADHAATLTELLGLVDERYQAALRAAIADMERMDKVERLKLDIFQLQGGYLAFGFNRPDGRAPTARAAIDGVPE